jgi:Fe-S-cluster containining protein
MLRHVPTRVFSLSIHADYRCRHSGQCCSTDWDVPVELPFYYSLTAALDANRLHTSAAAGTLAPFNVDPEVSDGGGVFFTRIADGRCVFLEPRTNLCIVHRDLGVDALPLTCRHFPRVSIRDRRGISITLSHYCPTAASMLFRDDVELRIVEEPPAFPPGDYDGLVVGDDDLPPLLHPHMLMDLDGYSAWEEHLVTRCTDLQRVPESVLATMMRDARLLAAWKPGSTTLIDAIARLPKAHVDAVPARSLDESLSLYRAVLDAVPEDLKPVPDEADLPDAFVRCVAPRWSLFHPPINRFIAAKSFATWTAYQGRGVATIVRGIEAAVALVRVEAARLCRDADQPLDADLLREAFRAADFALNHLAIGEDLALGWAQAEGLHSSNA